MIAIALSPGDDRRRGRGLGARIAWSSAACAYAALFGALSLRVKRPVVIGLIYVLFWEGSIATFAPRRLALARRLRRAMVAGGLPVVHRLQRPAIGGAGGGRACSRASPRPRRCGAAAG